MPQKFEGKGEQKYINNNTRIILGGVGDSWRIDKFIVAPGIYSGQMLGYFWSYENAKKVFNEICEKLIKKYAAKI